MAQNENEEQVKKLTLGERRVRVQFNPSNDDYVHQLKESGAKFIDLIDQAAANPKFKDEQFGDFARLKALAITSIEEGTMWVVKMATV